MVKVVTNVREFYIFRRLAEFLQLAQMLSEHYKEEDHDLKGSVSTLGMRIPTLSISGSTYDMVNCLWEYVAVPIKRLSLISD